MITPLRIPRLIAFVCISVFSLPSCVFPVPLCAAGEIVAWGGQGPVPLPNTGFMAIAGGGSNYSLGLKQDGSIVAWGNNTYGECNVPNPNTGFTAIAAGVGAHSLGLKQDGSIVAWGRNDDGQCTVPSPNTGFTAIACGRNHSFGLKPDGSIVAWGLNDYGQRDVPSPNKDFTAIAGGVAHSLGLKTDGSIVAWGAGQPGQQWGYPHYGQCTVPSPNTGFTAIACGGFHSLGLKTDGSIVAWGYNGFGECDVPSPNTGFTAIACGGVHSLGLKQDGSIVAWGHNGQGQLNVPEPNTGFVAIAGGGDHSLGLKRSIYLYVDANSPNNPGTGTPGDPFRHIQNGIDAAVDGITVVVAEGNYYENINFNGKNIILTSTDPNDPFVVANTIIDGNDVNSVIRLADVNAVINGFTIANGLAQKGGGIYCENSNLIINNCSVTGNNTVNGQDSNDGNETDGGNGAGIYMGTFCSLAINDSSINYNITGIGGRGGWYLEIYNGGNAGNGAGIYVGTFCSLTIKDSSISYNTTGIGGDSIGWDGNQGGGNAGNGGNGAGIYCETNSLLSMTTCLISDNNTGRGGQSLVGDGGRGGDGAGIYAVSSVLDINNCDLNNNNTGAGNWGGNYGDSGRGGDGGSIYCKDISLNISNSFIKNNTTGSGGYDSGDGGDGGYGGGIYGISSTLTISDCNITGNATGNGGRGDYGYFGGRGGDGAGIYCSSCSVTLASTVTMSNATGAGGAGGGSGYLNYPGYGGRGGGIYCTASSSLTMTDCVVSTNITGSGGDLLGNSHSAGGKGGDGAGIYCASSCSLTLENCLINDNVSGNGGSGGWSGYGGQAGEGAGIYCSAATIKDSAIMGNRIGNGGYGEYNGMVGSPGGGIYCISGTLDIIDCAIINNATGTGGRASKGGDGAGIYCSSSALPDIAHSIVANNRTGNGCSGSYYYPWGSDGGSGAGIFCYSGVIRNCVIKDNVTGNGGYAGLSYYSAPGGNGGNGAGIVCSSATIINCDITDNTTGRGGDGSVYTGSNGGNGGNGAGVFGPSTTIENCTISKNTAGIGGTRGGTGSNGLDGKGAGIFADSSTLITNTIVWENTADQIAGHDCNNVTYCDIGDGTCGGQNGNISTDPCFADPNYHLQCNSPCIDSGDPSSDYSNEPHPNGKRINMGAYGNTTEAEISCIDSDSDGIINPWEIEWQLDPCSPDTDNDGLTDYEEVCYDGNCNNYNPYNPYTGTGTDLNANSGDTDRDLMPDGWEVQYGLNPVNGTDTALDYDGDGFTNLQEYLHGSNPTDQNDIPQPMAFYVDNDALGDPGPNDPGISDPEEDGSPAHPFDKIQEAINIAIDSDTVVVLEGRYYENIKFNGKNITLTSTDPNDPNVVANTIIDGNDVNSVITFNSSEDSTCVLDGLTITHGHSDTGGGIYCYGSSPTVTNCVVTDNRADYGGGIAGLYSRPKISHCTIRDNNCIAGGEDIGGGLFFEGQQAYSSSIVLSVNGIIDPPDGQVRLNPSEEAVIDIYGDGTSPYGYFYLGIPQGSSASFDTTNVQMLYPGDHSWVYLLYDPEKADYLGINNPLIWMLFDDLVGPPPPLTGQLVSGIKLNFGESQDATLLLFDDYGNRVSSVRILRTGRQGTIHNCIISGNSATFVGGICILSGASLSLTNCTITNNTGNEPSVIYSEGGTTLTNCIVWGNSGGVEGVVPAYCDIQNWSGGTGNMSVDPCFVDPNGPDGDPNTSEDNDYHLLWNSPCIDAGDPDYPIDPNAFDIDGDMRVICGRIDIGADEYAFGELSDFSDDGIVNFNDLAILAYYWADFSCTDPDWCQGCDYDQSGVVDLEDLIRFAGDWLWGSSAPPPTNIPPNADAGPDQTVTDSDQSGSEQVTLNGSGSSDPDGSIVSYVWTENGNQIATGVSPTVTLPVGQHTITLQVTDNGGLTDAETVVIIIEGLL